MVTEPSSRLTIMKRLPVGLELAGDLREPLNEAEQRQLPALLAEHGLLVFRKQRLSHAQQIGVLSHCGSILRSPDGIGYISTDKHKGGLGTTELAFHSDLAFTPEPFRAISLHAIEVVDDATSTRFADGIGAYKALPAALRQRIAGLKVLSVMPIDMGSDRLDEEIAPGMPQFSHPVIKLHPVSGEPILYVNQQQTARVEGLEREAAKSLLRELFAYLYAPANVYEHRWHNGDLVIWDNLSLQHARGTVQGKGPRTLQRVVVANKSFFELCPQVRIDDPEYLQWINSADPAADRHLIERVVARGSGLM